MWWERRDRTNVWARWKHLAAFMRLKHLRFQTLTLFYQTLIINPLTRLKDFDLSLFTLTNVRRICHLAWSIEAGLFFWASLKRYANSMSTASTLCQKQHLAQICFMVSFTLNSHVGKHFLRVTDSTFAQCHKLWCNRCFWLSYKIKGTMHHWFSSSNRRRNLPRSARKSNWLCVKQESQRILDTWTMRTSR